MQIPLFPEQASTISVEVDQLLYFLVAVSVFFTLLIFAAIFYFAIRYRRRSETELPQHVHSGLTLEVVWTVIPFGITMVMFAWGASIFLIMECRLSTSASSIRRGQEKLMMRPPILCGSWPGSRKDSNNRSLK